MTQSTSDDRVGLDDGIGHLVLGSRLRLDQKLANRTEPERWSQSKLRSALQEQALCELQEDAKRKEREGLEAQRREQAGLAMERKAAEKRRRLEAERRAMEVEDAREQKRRRTDMLRQLEHMSMAVADKEAKEMRQREQMRMRLWRRKAEMMERP